MSLRASSHLGIAGLAKTTDSPSAMNAIGLDIKRLSPLKVVEASFEANSSALIHAFQITALRAKRRQVGIRRIKLAH